MNFQYSKLTHPPLGKWVTATDAQKRKSRPRHETGFLLIRGIVFLSQITIAL